MGRKILFVTTDQQRYDGLGCNGGAVARTPVVDALAAEGVRFERAHPQNVVCMPSRATMVTGQHVRTHGVWMNGVPLPLDAPSVAQVLRDAGYRTALIGKSHFEPFLDPFLRFEENRMGRDGVFGDGSHRGFDHMELATHGGVGFTHYAQWLLREHAAHIGDYYPVLDAASLEVNEAGGGDNGAPQVKLNPIPRELYHTDWVAERAVAWLESLPADEDWFCWVSFPDPHHPWDPPASERHRVDWRDLDLPAGFPTSREQAEAIVDDKPAHWRRWWEGTLTAEQVREVNALVHVENELVDEALGRILRCIDDRGWGDDVDVVYTTDHGEFQGDFGFLFKGPYHVDALMRLPLIWRPARSAAARPAPTVVSAPVGLVDLAPTFCTIAGVAVPDWMEGMPLPASPAEARDQDRQRVLTEWDSFHPTGVEVHLRTIHRDGHTCTVYDPGTVHDGTEGELYDHAEDPLQRVNLFHDPARRALRDDLVADLHDQQPAWASPPRRAEAPV